MAGQRAPRFDVVVLVETLSPEEIAGVRFSEAFEELGADFVMGARNARRIGDTEEEATFLFNHFTAADPEGAVGAWEDLTGYTIKTGVDNSTLLRPIGEAPYAFVNYAPAPRADPVHARPTRQAELSHVRADQLAREWHGSDAPAVRARLSGSVHRAADVHSTGRCRSTLSCHEGS